MIAITGHRGFIGSRLKCKFDEYLIVYHGDIEHSNYIDYNFTRNRVDTVYHLAKPVDYKLQNISTIDDLIESNYSISVRLLEVCRNIGCRFIFTTSYFADDPKSLYALQKRHIEETAKLYHDLYGVKVAIVKVFNTWSLDDTRDLFLSRVARGEVNESDLTEPDGIVKFSHVDEIVKCLADLADKDFDYLKIDVPYKEMTAKNLLRVDWSKQ